MIFTRIMRVAAALLSVALTPAALAQSTPFTLTYTTFADGINSPVAVSATLNATRDIYSTTGYIVTSITGTRGAPGAIGSPITGLTDPSSEFYFPATTLPGYGFATYLDSFGISFSVGGVEYQIYRDPGDSTFYHESQNPNGISVGRLILPSSFSIAQAAVVGAVPELSTWAMMIVGFGIAGTTLRRRRATVMPAASA